MTNAADEIYERVLVLRCQAGDEAAFAELVERYQSRLRYYLRQDAGRIAGGRGRGPGRLVRRGPCGAAIAKSRRLSGLALPHRPRQGLAGSAPPAAAAPVD